ncbi:MAG: sigma-54-dependent Fis family transcriptional regulator [Deltaproteobacteria bacterium]|nr:sigma-54-dependent Fis family transcriptional regulator [Deltaproteobacteria bacterium]
MRILIIDDEESMRHMLSLILKKEGYDVVCADNAKQALNVLAKQEFGFILCDIKMPEMDGLEFLKSLLAPCPLPLSPVVIMMSAYGTIDTAIECMKLGAYDYISKPFKSDEIILTLKKAEERERLRRENLRLKHSIAREYNFENIITKSKEMLDVFNLIKKVCDYDTTVLITGESGTGKELVARAIHYSGARKDKPFIAVNCGAIPHALIESELFGHIKGAFTDAIKTKAGLFEEADKGTLFLDEIGELPADMQVKLLRVLQEGEVRKVGDTKSIKIDVRVISATTKNLLEEIKKGSFREDLFYRLNVVEIHLPSLRERQDDIPILADYFLKRHCMKFSKNISMIDKDAMDLLLSYKWQGNVRELENVIERAVILEDTDVITPNSLPFLKQTPDTRHQTLDKAMLSIKKAEESIEKELIKKALDMTSGNKTHAAKLLEISHRALLYKIKEYGL